MAGWISTRMSVLAIAVLLAAPAVAQPAPNTFRAVPIQLVRIFDPHFTSSFTTRDFGYLVFDTLFAINDKFEPQPQMVERWTVSPDQLTYRFTLRAGLKWHDGAPVTAADCVASIRRWATRDGMGQALLAAAKDLVVVDDKSFEILLREPYGQVVPALSKVGALVPFMMPKRLAETPASQQIPEVIGSGPYRFRSDLSPIGVKVVLDRFADYVPRSEPPVWASGAKLAKVDRIELNGMPDSQTAANALIRGEVDFVEAVPIDLLPLVEKSPDLHVRVTNKLGFQNIMRMNEMQPPFNDIRVRRAVAMAVDQTEYLEAQIGNPEYFKVCAAMYMCDTPLATAAGAPVRDLAKAKQLIAESGWPLKTPIVLLNVTDSPSIAPLAPVTAQMLRALGFTVDVQSMDFGAFASRRLVQGPVSEGGWNIGHSTLTGPEVANPSVSVALDSSGTAAAWWGWPKDAEVERLRSAYAHETDPAKQKQIAEQVQIRAYDQVVYLPLGEFQNVTAARANIVGLLDAPPTLLYNIEKK
ncbi:MAG: ABC transporter substrate-binding protein [Pseudomonadota bacterium]